VLTVPGISTDRLQLVKMVRCGQARHLAVFLEYYVQPVQQKPTAVGLAADILTIH
jgi:hypothetical protein